MRIKFTAAFDNRGDEAGKVAELAVYSVDADIEQHTAALAELFRDMFDRKLSTSPCQKKTISLSHAVEQDLSTDTLVWRVYVRGFVCCQPAAAMIIDVMSGLARRYFEFIDEGVKQPPTNFAFYEPKRDDKDAEKCDDKPERILN